MISKSVHFKRLLHARLPGTIAGDAKERHFSELKEHHSGELTEYNPEGILPPGFYLELAA